MAGVRRNPLPSGKFQGWYIDHTGKRTFFVYSSSRSQTLRIAQRLEDDHRQIRLGYRPVPKIENPRSMRGIQEVMDEYLAWGKAQGGRNGRPWGRTHLRNRRSQLEWWRQRLNIHTLGELYGTLPQVEGILRDLQQNGRTPKTIANYAETISAFCVWCEERDFLDEDPLKKLGSLPSLRVAHRVDNREFKQVIDMSRIPRKILEFPPRRRNPAHGCLCGVKVERLAGFAARRFPHRAPQTGRTTFAVSGFPD